MQSPPQIAGGGLSNQIRDFLPFLMMGGQNSTAVVYFMYFMVFFEKLLMQAPLIIAYLRKVFTFVETKVAQTATAAAAAGEPAKTSSITIDINFKKPESMSGAIMDLITNNKNTRFVSLANGHFTINDNKPILLDEDRDIWARLLAEKKVLGVGEKESDDGVEKQVIMIYSHSLNVQELRRWLDQITKTFLIKIQNKLGDNVYFFNAIPIPAFVGPDKKKDYSKLPPFFHFTMKPFRTNRRFSNVIGEQSRKIRKRVEFFLKNEKWYDSKGVPYTLGFLLSGPPGSGKTSTIKCLANETERHIINVAFNDDITKSQMENLFFNETINVVSNHKTEQYIIPIEKRIYVFEDVDCQSEVVMQRADEPASDPTAINFAADFKPVDAFTSGRFSTGVMTHAEPVNPTVAVGAEKLTLSTLLNLLDGILETPGRIIIMTSNYPRKLDQALIRPGRIDLICEFGFCTRPMIREMLESFYGVALDSSRIQSLPEGVWSPAELMKIMFENFEDMEGALRTLQNAAMPFTGKLKRLPGAEEYATEM